MTTDKDFELRVAEEYGKAFAILETLQQTVEKLKEDPSKKSSKVKSTITDIKLNFSGTVDGMGSLRSDVGALLEKCVLATKDLDSMDQAIRKLSSLRSKLEAEDITKAECTKWLEDLESIKNSLERRHQIKRIDSERQASVSSLTEQLKQKEETISQLNQKIQEMQKQEPPK